MKKSIIAAVAAGIMTLAGMAAVKTVSHEASLFERNVEALTEPEKGTPIYYVCEYIGCCGGDNKCFSGSFSYRDFSISGTFYMD